MHRSIIAAAAACLLTAACTPSPSVSGPEAPAASGAAAELSATDPARQAIAAALDARLRTELGQPGVVAIEILRAEGDWAFASGPATAPDGTAIDFSKTLLAQRAADGVLDGSNVIALLKKTGEVWAVTEFFVGPTDVPQVAWPDQYGVSPALVGQEG